MINSIYNSLGYWDTLLRENLTMKEKIFKEVNINEKTPFFHTVIFTRNNGMEILWSPCNDVKSLIGYIQYAFLPQAFYFWIEGADKKITKYPILTADKIILNGEKAGKLSKDEAYLMKVQLGFIKGLWGMPRYSALKELKNFSMSFNNTWFGNSNGFMYLQVFESAQEMGKFVVNTNKQTSSEKSFQESTGLKEDEWINLCKGINNDKGSQEKFLDILYNVLNHVV